MKAGGGRVARRAVRRWSRRLLRWEWRQQLLVLALLAVAVAAAVFAAVAAYNVAPSRDAEFGAADVRFEYVVSESDAIDAYVQAAQKWFGTAELIGRRAVDVPGSTTTIELRAQDLDGPLGSPMVAVMAGRAPMAPEEVALTDEAAALLGVRVGSSARLDDRDVTVVGSVENPADLDDEFALVPAGTGVPEHVTVLARAGEDRARQFRPSREPGTGFFEMRGATENTTAALVVLVVASVAMVLVSLVAGAAFFTLAHRRQRQLGMLAVLGATRRQLRRAMVANGAGVGVVAAVIGTSVALGSWLIVAPALERAAGHRIDRFAIPLWVPAAGMLLAVATSSLAAWWPALAVARVPVTDAIAARPPRVRTLRRPLIVATALLIGGITGIALGIDPSSDQVSAPLFLGGLVATVLSTVLLAAPVLRGVARLAGRLPFPARLATRDLARFQGRSAAALGAISLGLAVAVGVVIIAAANEPTADRGNLSERQLMVWTSPPSDVGNLFIPAAQPEDLPDLEERVAEVAAIAGAAVVPIDAAVDPTIPSLQGGRRFVPTAHLGRPVGGGTIRDGGTGLEAVRAGRLLQSTAPLAEADLQQIRSIAADGGLAVEDRDEKPSLTTIRTAASAAGILLALGILAMTLGLLRGDAAHVDRTLVATGATGATRRHIAASTAGVLAAVGVVLGTGMAYAALIAGYWPQTDRLANVPLAHLAAIAVGLPAAATVGSWLAAGRTPTRISAGGQS